MKRLALIPAVAITLAVAPVFANGSIEGTVKLEGPTPALKPHAVVRDASACGKDAPNETVVVGKSGALRNVVVSIKDARFEGKLAPVAGAALDQKLCRYVPHVQALTLGTSLSVMNNDAILHNVHANVAGLTVFNVAMPIKGQKLPMALRKPGLIKLQCDAGHTWMNGWIHVFPHPYFAVTDDNGSFVIKDVPAGEHTLDLWHEPADGKGAGVYATAKVKVTADAPARVDLTFKL